MSIVIVRFDEKLYNMNKKIKSFLLMFTALAAMTSCETMKPYETEYSPITPVCGSYRVKVTNVATGKVVNANPATLTVYDTADKVNDKCWLFINNTTYGFKMKANVNPSAKTFDMTAGQDMLQATRYDVSVAKGLVELDMWSTKSGGKADKVSFTYTTNRGGSEVTYAVEGFRWTNWNEDGGPWW